MKTLTSITLPVNVRHTIFYKNGLTMEENASAHDKLRQHVVEVAAKAFLVDGIKSVTMDSIAHRLSMSKRTLYQIFRDKEDLLLACLENRRQQDIAYVEELEKQTDNVMEIILSFFAHKMAALGEVSPAYLPDLKRYPRLLEACANNRRHEEAESVAFMERGIEQGIFRPEVDFRIVMTLMHDLVDFIMSKPQLRDYRLEPLLSNTAMVILRGCATEKGLAMIDDFFQKFRASTVRS